MSLLTLQDAELAFGLHPLLDRANLVVGEGERIGLIGRNGTGKSSLLQVIAGQRELDDGQLQTRDGLAVVLVEQEPELPRASTLRECLALRGRLDAIHDERERWRTEARLVEYLHRFGLDEATAPESASGGEKKRAALALALALAPDLLLLDEPTNHLDLDGIARVEDLVRQGAGGDRDHARPRVSRSRGHAHRRARPRPAALLSRQFRRVRDAQGRRARRRSDGQPQVRPVLGAGRGVDPQGDRGAPHARRGPRAAARIAAPRAQRTPRPSRQREARGRCRRALGPARRGALARHQGVRRTHAGARPHAAHHARRPAGPDRRQRRGQVDAPEADPRHDDAGFGHGQAGRAARRSRISTSCASSSTASARSPRRSARVRSGWRRPAGASTCSPISATSCFRRSGPTRRCARCRAASATGCCWRGSSRGPANLLVLDEPTNDLDIESLELLESTLQTLSRAPCCW